jgi:hypothetical protein
MKPIDPDAIRALVRQELTQRLGSFEKPALPQARAGSILHPSHLEIFTEPGCEEEQDFSPGATCLIEPHRLCFHSGYCKKLGY